jgi:hypothetical protein
VIGSDDPDGLSVVIDSSETATNPLGASDCPDATVDPTPTIPTIGETTNMSATATATTRLSRTVMPDPPRSGWTATARDRVPDRGHESPARLDRVRASDRELDGCLSTPLHPVHSRDLSLAFC